MPAHFLSSRREARKLGPALLGLGLLAVLGTSSGCVPPLRREPLTADQILQMTKDKAPPDLIIQKIRDSRTVYVLHAEDVKALLDKGIDPKVVDEMLETRVREAEYNCGYYYPYPYYPYPYYYGPYFGIGYRFDIP